MLQFFRRYQKVLFLITTVLIVFSFAFFGAFQAIMSTHSNSDPVVYTTKHGTKIRSSQMQVMVNFLANERVHPLIPRDLINNNFFNKGWISKELLASAAAEKLILKSVSTEPTKMESQFSKERHYSPYSHPSNPNLNSEIIWGFVAPQINENLNQLRAATNWKEALPSKIQLYLAQQDFSPIMLTQTLLYSGGQAGGDYDPRLINGDLSLFHYHSLSDWFGEAFVELCAQLVFEATDLARSLGVKVSNEELQYTIKETLFDTYKALGPQIKDQLPHPFALYQIYLRHRGWTQNTFESCFETLLLCNRLLDKFSNVPLVDSLSFEDFHSYAYEYSTVKLKQLPNAITPKNQQHWAAFEAYLRATSPRVSAVEFSLDPNPIQTITTRAPYLVGREYRFFFKEVSLKQLESKVSLKETWDWEHDLKNRKVIEKAFPDLARGGVSWETSVESLTNKRRKLLDAFARQQIVKRHPEWLEMAFQQNMMKEANVVVSESGDCKNFPLKGIKDISLLLKEIENQNEITSYSQDEQHFYRILRNQELQEKQILTFAQCLDLGIDKKLINDFQGEQELASLRRQFNAQGEDLSSCIGRFAFLFEKLDEEITAYGKQFLPEEKTLTLSRAEPSSFNVEKIFSQPLGESSKPEFQDGKFFSIEVIDHQIDTSAPVKQLAQMQTLLHSELRNKQIQHFIDSFIDDV